jgi:hypothetical protein
MAKFNAVVFISEFEDGGENWVNISIATPDHQDHEIVIHKKDFVVGRYWIPAEYSVNSSCCEHPNGCPEGSSTDKFLKTVNDSK